MISHFFRTYATRAQQNPMLVMLPLYFVTISRLFENRHGFESLYHHKLDKKPLLEAAEDRLDFDIYCRGQILQAQRDRLLDLVSQGILLERFSLCQQIIVTSTTQKDPLRIQPTSLCFSIRASLLEPNTSRNHIEREFYKRPRAPTLSQCSVPFVALLYVVSI